MTLANYGDVTESGRSHSSEAIVKPYVLQGGGEGGGDGAKNAAIILVGRGSNGAVAFGNNGRGEELQEGLSSRSSLARPPPLSLAHSPPPPPSFLLLYKARPSLRPQSAREPEAQSGRAGGIGYLEASERNSEPPPPNYCSTRH